jgi:small-conductance mechanosensitive channel
VHHAVSRRLAAKQEVARRVLTLGDFQVLDVVRLQAFTERGFALFLWILGLGLLDLWLTFCLKRFPYTQVWGESIQSWFFGQLGMLGRGAIGALPGLITVVIIFVVARLLTRVLVQFFGAVQASRVTLPWLHPDTAPPTLRILIVLLWLFAIMVAYPFMPGSGSGVFKGITLFAGAVFSLGSSALVGQFMSGLVLMYSRAFRRGDYVRVGECEGTILELGMLSTKIRTNKRELVTIPNSVVVGQEMKNYSRLAEETGVIVSTSVTIGYDAPWRQVHAMLEEAAARTTKLKREPPPYVYQMALSDFYVEYQLFAYLEFPNERIPVLAALHANIQDVFNEHGVQIMSPHFESQPEGKVVAPREIWYAPPAKPPDGGPAKPSEGAWANPPEGAPAKPSKRAPAEPPGDAPAPRVGE